MDVAKTTVSGTGLDGGLTTATHTFLITPKVGRCRLPVSNLVLTVRTVSALEATI